MKKFLEVLKNHPSNAFVKTLMVLGLVTFARGDYWYIGGAIGVTVMGLLGTAILWIFFKIKGII